LGQVAESQVHELGNFGLGGNAIGDQAADAEFGAQPGRIEQVLDPRFQPFAARFQIGEQLAALLGAAVAATEMRQIVEPLGKDEAILVELVLLQLQQLLLGGDNVGPLLRGGLQCCQLLLVRC
jgi:hypothetical protein